MKTINILGDSQREQWHSVVNMLRQLGGDLTYEGRSQLCDELDRYIDAMEDANEARENEKLFVLASAGYIEGWIDDGVDAKLYANVDAAREQMRAEWQEVIDEWELKNEEHRAEISDNSAYISCSHGEIVWNINEQGVKE